MRTFIIVCLAILVAITLLKASEARSQRLIEVGECVERLMDDDNYKGEYRTGWEMYAPLCVK